MPSSTSSKSIAKNIYDLECEPESSFVHLLPVPWEATTSYLGGTSNGPQAIYDASFQLDFTQPHLNAPESYGIFWNPVNLEIKMLGENAKNAASKSRSDEVNALSSELNNWVYDESKKILAGNKKIGIVGGDHSVPYGAIRALCETSIKEEFGILHVDAHMDLREAYQGFLHSHASIMNNLIKDFPQISKLVQVGIRDFCAEEMELAQRSDRIVTHFDVDTKRALFSGTPWATLVEKMIKPLPEEVWISFDIDGLDPRYCPNTGTPVPGGLDFCEAEFLISQLVRSGRKVIGFDLCEVSPGKTPTRSEWDANVGMRMLYKLSTWMIASHHPDLIRST